MAISKKTACIFLFIITVSAFSQVLEGRIFDKETETPLEGATVYLDGTTVVKITDNEGYFKISAINSAKTLVVSFVGYATYRLENLEQYQNRRLKLYLDKESTGLQEVVIGKGPFSRKEMMEVFKRQFLGTSKSALSCKIQNEDDIHLYFDVVNNTLNASARNPLKIINKHLEYEVNFDLIEFVQKFSVKSLKPYFMGQSYFAGSTFYRDFSEQGKADKKRLKVFNGSAPHLMITIANEDWEKQSFGLFVNGFIVDPKQYFLVTDTIGLKKVRVIKQPINEKNQNALKSKIIIVGDTTTEKEIEKEKTFFNILYQKEAQSIVDFRGKEILVDENGNYSPLYDVLFGGALGMLKAGDMLPRDYYQTVKRNQNN